MSGQTPEQIQQNFSDLDYTQDIRRQIVAEIAPAAIKDKDPEMLDKTMKALDGMDKVSLGRLKINEKAKENQTRQDESEALAKYLIAKSNQRTEEGIPEKKHSAVAGSKLPSDLRPDYDPAIRDQTPGTENTRVFTERVEGQSR